jgi:Domain of unknown function (DUF4395)
MAATATETHPSQAGPRVLKSLFAFPDPVNEVSARVVAGGVVALSLAAIALDSPLLRLLLAYGFVARALTGPTLSPLGQLATRVVTPRLAFEAKLVAGPPKRFAQAIGVLFSLSSVVLALGFGETLAADLVLGALIVAATLESAFGICLGCKAFALAMRAGLVPGEVCERCNDIWAGRELDSQTDALKGHAL